MFKIVTIPFDEGRRCFLEEELNKFCLNKTIKDYKAEFFQSSKDAYWTIFIEYETVLNDNVEDIAFTDAQKLLFERLREWRKQKAEEKRFPVYVVCNNSQLTAIVKEAPKTIEALKDINGFGKKKIEDYGKEIISIIKDFYEEE